MQDRAKSRIPRFTPAHKCTLRVTLCRKHMFGRAIIFAVVGCAISAQADTITLTDGQKFTGTLKPGDGIDTITQEDGKEIVVPHAQVASVTPRAQVSPAEVAQRDWTDVS